MIESRFEVNETDMKMQRIGEKMMDMGCKLDDHAKANMYSIVGNELSRAGELFARRFTDLNAEEKECVYEVARTMGFKC